MKNGQFTYGQGLGIKILIANELGAELGYTHEAQLLASNKVIDFALGAIIEKTAYDALHYLINNNLLHEAQKLLNEKY